MFLFIQACAKKEENLVNVKLDPETTPTMITDTAVMLISDSGRTRYKITADIYEVFDKSKDPHTFFPKGFHLERFDDKFKVEAIIVADTAWNYTARNLWRLKGNVFIRNMVGDEFKSDELFWDQIEAKVYSDKYIEIKRGLTELKGYGFESNSEMTDYKIFKVFDGKYPFQDNAGFSDPTQTFTDSIP